MTIGSRQYFQANFEGGEISVTSLKELNIQHQYFDPTPLRVPDLLNQTFSILGATPCEQVSKFSGEIQQGYRIQIEDLVSGERHYLWIYGVVLVQTLDRLVEWGQWPVEVTLVRRGKAYQFVDPDEIAEKEEMPF